MILSWGTLSVNGLNSISDVAETSYAILTSSLGELFSGKMDHVLTSLGAQHFFQSLLVLYQFSTIEIIRLKIIFQHLADAILS